MNFKKISLFAAALATSVWAQSPEAIEETVAPVAAPETAPETVQEVSPVETPAAPVEETPAVTEPVSAAPVTATSETVDETAPVVVRNGEKGPSAENSPTASATFAVESAQNSDDVAPQAVRGGAGDAPKATTGKKVVYERVYMGPDGIPVRAIYVAEEPASADGDNALDRFPMKFKLGATASVNSYYLSNDDFQYDDWYESFSGFSWRAGLIALVPLNQSTIGLKVGVLYEQSSASESYYINEVPTQFTFEQRKIDIPVLFSFKAFGSRLLFDLGPQVSVPLQDKLKVSFNDPDSGKKVKSSKDLKDDYRNAMDWSLVFGFSIMANNYLSLDLRAELGLSEIYDGTIDYLDLGLSSSSFGIGFTVYPF